VPPDWFNTVTGVQVPPTVVLDKVIAPGDVGKMSLTAILVTLPGLLEGLVKVYVSAVVAPTPMLAGLKALATVGGA
jgi:hypothetical protein